MKSFSSAITSQLTNDISTLATCWKIICRNGIVLGFTDHDADIEHASRLYHASSGFTPTALASNSALSVNNIDIEGMLDSALITSEDISAGVYDYAEIEIFMVDYTQPDEGSIHLKTGWIGEITVNNGRFVAELRGLTQNLNTHIGALYSPTCRAQFGDAQCGVTMTTRTATGHITSVTSRRVFRDTARTETTETYRYGIITFTSGANANISREIRLYQAAGIFTLLLPLPYDLTVGDAYSVIQGCDRTFSTCCNRFNNAVNFRGEPHVPGLDKIMETAGTRSRF